VTSTPSTAPPPYDRLLDERGKVCPLPVISLARMTHALPAARLLLLSDDPAAESDVPAWCGLRGRKLEWVGDAPDGRGRAFLVVPQP
jgi:TusA-related sulfurtransferase